MNQTMRITLVGKGDVIVFGLPGTDDVPPVNIAVSDEEFINGIRALIAQAKHHPESMLRKLKVEDAGR